MKKIISQILSRTRFQGCSIKKLVFKNFTKFIEKHLCQSLFFNKVVDNFIKKKALAQLFFCEFCETFKNTFFTEHLLEIASVFQWKLRINIPEYEFLKTSIFITILFQKPPPRGVFKKLYSENMHQIYTRTSMPKSDFNKVALQ